MNAEAKIWVKAEQKRGQRAARLPVMFGAAQVVCGIFQAYCAAQLLAAVLGLAPRGNSIIVNAIGFMLFALLRAGANMQFERLGFERGAAASAQRRARNPPRLGSKGPAGQAFS